MALEIAPIRAVLDEPMPAMIEVEISAIKGKEGTDVAIL
jgi:hypothetical protein